MKKQYIFLIMIGIILYLSFRILTFMYNNYTRNSDIAYIEELMEKGERNIKQTKSDIEYVGSKAYKNKVKKEQQSRKNYGEKVVYFTSEEKYNNYTRSVEDATAVVETVTAENIETGEMSINEKWMYFLFSQ